MLTVGSLFSGIGGLDLGLERAGFKVIWQSEIDPYCNKVLKKHWPEVPNHGNIKDINWSTIERPNVICGGYPCQPFSTAGKRKGTDDPRHLWPWVRTAISELRPDYAILENVQGHVTLGGLQVIGELAEIGYDAEWRIVSAAGVGAPHRRNRIIIVAYPNGQRLEGTRPKQQATGTPRSDENKNGVMADTKKQFSHGRGHGHHQGTFERGSGIQVEIRGSSSNVADSNSEQLGERGKPQNAGQTRSVWKHHARGQEGYDGWQWWQVEPNVGRVADGVPNRVDRLRGLGNAVVPQVAEYIGHLIMAAHNNA